MGFDRFPSKPGDIPALDIIEELRIELAAERERVEKLSQENAVLRCDAAGGRERVAKLREALERVLIGGNHIALLIGADHPPHTATHDEARAHYTSQDVYEIWCCWRTMMHARAVLEETKGDGDE